MTPLPPALTALLDAQGVDAARSRRVLAALSDGGWWTSRELVRGTAVAHRLVEAVLTALGDDLRRDGDRCRLADPAPYESFAEPPLADPVQHLAGAHPRAAAELERLVAEAPPPRTDLDHVAATPETALRRAALLAGRFALSGRRLLCVGDHDLTSLAATLVQRDAEAVVVDIDERMLDYIDTAAARLGLPVRCHFADLRLGLPPAVRGRADLVFTDPPYTPEGVELFVRRGLEGLADPDHGRVLLAYGASETTPALLARTQSRLTRLNLAFEAIWPDFNRYLGAEAIGAASDLYVLRPTSRTPAGAEGREAARIYSQGAHARESAGGLADSAVTELLDRTSAGTLVGAWPSWARPDARRIRLATWLAAPAGPEAGTSPGGALVDLTGGWDALLERVLLAAPAGDVHVVVPSGAAQVRDAVGQNAVRAAVGTRYELRFLRGFPDPRHTVVAARYRAADPGDAPGTRLLRHCQDRAHGSVAAVLREGLIRVAAGLGRPINKKQARTRVAAAAPWLSGHTLLDLPLHRVAALPGLTADLVAELPAA
ncbi:bis-aminopropyl spermidine synthase family protein [Marinitenerispora sediminis]|uniref:Putative methyltransferase n=1 Tax=Marinitenerispora sediminis TaxID=1931232 RepID=A0A368T1Q2_9ACTN|nr:bis-aminopropyl spermidine synthase family protein [Marinitenerispora sediminis]RCV50739.1 putative methyltransferase [Marinitenerispora sediminis]RCV54083.1 putative methyltransferase [Marinitenerispora sediminis]RCV56337.1 putative methyltransferase [Marinitenerispora sediminis]